MTLQLPITYIIRCYRYANISEPLVWSNLVDPWFFECGADFIHIVWSAESKPVFRAWRLLAVIFRQWDFAAEVKFLGSHFEFHGIEFWRHAVFSTAHFIIGLR